MRVVVLPSPYLGPAAYGPLAEALGADVAALPPEPFSASDVLAAFAEATAEADLVVPHSNAGLHAAASTGAHAEADEHAAAARLRQRRPGLVRRVRHHRRHAVTRSAAFRDSLVPPWRTL